MARDTYESYEAPAKPPFPKKLIWILGSTLVLSIFSLIALFSIIEVNAAGWISVKQSISSGDLAVYSKSGPFAQWFGDVTRYKQVVTIGFGASGEDGTADMGAVNVQFNDSGKADVFGNARFELPASDDVAILKIHNDYRGFDHLVDTLLEPYTADILIATANIFSSEDTYAGGRAQFQAYAEDQLKNGKYLTDVSEIEQEDPLTHDKRRVKKVTIRKGEDGHYLRQESVLAHYKIKATQLLINKNFKYEDGVLAQIKSQRDAFMQTVTARAEAQKASQEAITAQATGQKNVTEAEYRKLVIKKEAEVLADQEKAVALVQAQRQVEVAKKEKETAETVAAQAASVAQIEAEQRLKVAELGRAQAEAEKAAAIARGEGEAKARELILAADGALKLKLEVYENTMGKLAEAIGNYKGAWVPSTVVGGTAGSGGVMGPADMWNLLGIQAARNLGLDLSTTPKPAVVTSPK